jgi:hypothetical protein
MSGLGKVDQEPGWAEIFLPIQAFTISNIQTQEPKKHSGIGVPAYVANRHLAQMSYHTSLLHLPCVAVFTPFCKVAAWDSTTGRLDLEIDDQPSMITKLNALQEMIQDMLLKQSKWLPSHQRTRAAIEQTFHKLLRGTMFTVYVHGSNPEGKQTGRVWMWKTGVWQKGVSQASFRKGQQIRLAIRFQGICFLPSSNGGDVYTRLQHQVISIIHKIVST